MSRNLPLPKSMKILGKTYRIKERTPTNPTDLGYVEMRKQLITISPDQHPSQKEDTLLHEVIHVLSGEMGLGLTEKQTTGLAAGLYSIGVRVPR